MKFIFFIIIFYLITKIFNNIKLVKKNKDNNVIDVDFEEVDESN